MVYLIFQRHCPNPLHCSPVAMIKMGVSLWQPNIPPRCVADQKRGKNLSPNSVRFFSRRDGTWKCFFGSVVYPYIEGNLFGIIKEI